MLGLMNAPVLVWKSILDETGVREFGLHKDCRHSSNFKITLDYI